MTDTPAGKPSGYDVVTADSGHRALGLIQGQRFEVALVDVTMLGMDGLTLVDRIMAEDPHFQIIILTGNPRLGDVRKGLKEGVFDYLTKPQKVEDLVTVIRSARKRRGELEEEGRKADIDRIMRERPDIGRHGLFSEPLSCLLETRLPRKSHRRSDDQGYILPSRTGTFVGMGQGIPFHGTARRSNLRLGGFLA
jgi:CheY-like chemotaxis protein